MKLLKGDRIFFALVILLSLAGIAIFSSAALGLLARSGASVSHEILLQTTLGLGLGYVGLFIARGLPLSFMRRYAPHAFVAGLLLTAAVFIPGVGLHANGATRWINVRFTTVQPAELLKIVFVFMLAWWLAPRARELRDPRKGLIPFLVLIGAPSLILLAQPNTSTTLLLIATGATMYFVAGAPYRDFAILAALAVVVFGGVLLMRPYVLQRVQTFFNPSAHSLSSSYQIQQSLIAVGSGRVLGMGFGQGVEKFNYLPEPDGDSVFAVYAEETGFIGALLLVIMFVSLAARGMVIASNARDLFGGLLVVGFSILIIMQAFINISAMLGLIPLTGMPLPFVSHGGTALFAVLVMCGVILNVSATRMAPKLV